jgi:branched-chain amino acid transport system permease protein
VLGGMGNIAGVILGAVLLTIFPEALRYIGELQNYLFGRILADPADLRMLIFGLALVLIMIFRPAGLLPSVRRRQEFGSDASVLAQEQASLYDTRR